MERQIGIRFEHEELAATIHYPNRINEGDRQKRVPLVVICHGFVGNRIGVDRLFVKTARELAEGGYFVLRFDFAGCGESTGEYGKQGLESMINQTRTVLDYAVNCADIDPTKVTLIGHSLGAQLPFSQPYGTREYKIWFFGPQWAIRSTTLSKLRSEACTMSLLKTVMPIIWAISLRLLILSR